MSVNTRTRPRSRRTRAKKVRYTYESDIESQNALTENTRPSRRSQRIQSYLEDTEDESESGFESLPSESDPSQRTNRRALIYRPPPTRSKTMKRKRMIAAPKSTKHNFQLFKRRKPNTAGPATKSYKYTIGPPPSGRIPRWQELPYQVLQQVMKYASHPLYEKASNTTSSIEWLCGVSLLCRSFHEACIAALLYSPPLYPSFRAHGLLHLLGQDQAKTFTNYRNKIKRLDIEVKHLLIRKSGIVLTELLDRAPLLERLHLYHNHDDLSTVVWAQPSQEKGQRFAYPDGIFQKLDDMNIRLKSWEWNGRFPNARKVLQSLAGAHVRPSFAELQELSFLNIILHENASDEENTLANTLLISEFHSLPDLNSLTFRNCTTLNTITLGHLPPKLSSLEISNCQYLTSDCLSIYLSTSGSSLTSLKLAGNQSMSLAFLANLSSLCPRLQGLSLDLTYTDPSSYHDRDPLYDEALPDGPPTWPTSLRWLDIENLRQISSSEAEEFFTSLVSSAPMLEHLRRIVIKAIVKDGSWRDRAEIRKKWIPILEEVFLDRSEPLIRRHVTNPRPESRIQVRVPESNSESKQPEKAKVDEEQRTQEKKAAGRQSSRIAHLKKLSISPPHTNSSDSNDSNFSDSNTSFTVRSAQAFVSSAPHLRSDFNRAIHATKVTDGNSARSNDRFFRQGKCSTVSLVLSDQRPAQEQYHEGDFLDSERSGDEEWQGRDLDFD